jgi:hypothetical protein|tara:strand:+ start:3918 stop:4175 length:258 start_codon:yes stop_codon:yes gene_type:complete
MPKIIEEAKQLGTVKLDDGREIPKMSCRSETTITNIKTGYEYSSEEEVQKDIDSTQTETKAADIRRDVKIFAPKLADMIAPVKKS